MTGPRDQFLQLESLYLHKLVSRGPVTVVFIYRARKRSKLNEHHRATPRRNIFSSTVQKKVTIPQP
jgi:hypothetical protein